MTKWKIYLENFALAPLPLSLGSGIYTSISLQGTGYIVPLEPRRQGGESFSKDLTGLATPESSTAGTALSDSSSILSVWAVSVPDPLSTNDPSRSCGVKIPLGVCRVEPDPHT